MGQPAAKQGDLVQATDNHLEQPPGTAPPVLKPNPFAGQLDGKLCADVKIQGKPAAVVGSTATNSPAHLPTVGTFVNPPKNRGRVVVGSATVKINSRPAARNNDQAMTCNDPQDLPVGKVVAAGTVRIG
jgi:uncharacterized Zn-binding protein involved in type VI secretion